MNTTSIGDLAQTFVQRRANVGLTRELNRLGTELVTGLRENVGTATSGDVGAIAGIERNLASVRAYKTAASEAALMMSASQSALNLFGETAANLSDDLAAVRGSVDPVVNASLARGARDAFNAMAASLNTSAAGRSLFGGTATDVAPVAGGEAMLATLAADLGASTAITAGDIASFVDDWFSDTGAFMTGSYRGATDNLAPMRVSPEDRATFDVRADDPAIRASLAATAKAAILDLGTGAGDQVLQQSLLTIAGDDIFGTHGGITALRSGIGVAQERIDIATGRVAAEETALQIARVDLIGADQYETATRLQGTQAQLEALYTVTARMSRLSLTNYL